MSTTFDFGNRTITASVGGPSPWVKEGVSRTYYALTFSGAKLPPIDKLYEVHAGPTRDETFTIGARTFAYIPGLACDSKTKRTTVAEAVRVLAQDIIAAHP